MKASLKYLFFLVLSGVFYFSLLAQKNSVDSLVSLLEKAESDTLRINLMLEISSECQGKNNDKAIKYAKNAYVLAKSISNTELIVQTLNYLGNSYYYKGDYEQTIAYYLQALTEYERSGHDNGIANILNNIGVVYYAWGQYSKALNYYQKSLAAFEKTKDRLGISRALNNIGNLYFNNKNFDSALVNYNSSLKIKQELNDQIGEALLLNNIGNVYAEKGDYKVARHYFLSSLKIYQAQEESYGEALALINISLLFKEEQRFDSALFYIQKALSLSENIGAEDQKTDCYETLTSIYEEMGNHKEALKNYRLYIDTKNKIKSQETQSAIEELNLKYETEKKEQQIALQETQLAKERLLRNGLILLVVLFIALVILIFKAYRDKQKTTLKLAEQNKTIEHQKMIVEEKQKALLDSIQYAKRIQQALLTSESYIEKSLKRLKN
ncbi:MAG: tetratricopeptide repeat protein [Bacteroidia bacterium]